MRKIKWFPFRARKLLTVTSDDSSVFRLSCDSDPCGDCITVKRDLVSSSLTFLQRKQDNRSCIRWFRVTVSLTTINSDNRYCICFYNDSCILYSNKWRLCIFWYSASVLYSRSFGKGHSITNSMLHCWYKFQLITVTHT